MREGEREEAAPTFSSKLADWVSNTNTPAGRLTQLLELLHPYHNDLPLDARTLLQTLRSIKVAQIGGGSYHYFEIAFESFCHLVLGLRLRCLQICIWLSSLLLLSGARILLLQSKQVGRFNTGSLIATDYFVPLLAGAACSFQGVSWRLP